MRGLALSIVGAVVAIILFIYGHIWAWIIKNREKWLYTSYVGEGFATEKLKQALAFIFVGIHAFGLLCLIVWAFHTVFW